MALLRSDTHWQSSRFFGPRGYRTLAATLLSLVACTQRTAVMAPRSQAAPLVLARSAQEQNQVPADGRFIFRHWTFGDEPFWTDTLHLNDVVETAVSPTTALAVGGRAATP